VPPLRVVEAVDPLGDRAARILESLETQWDRSSTRSVLKKLSITALSHGSALRLMLRLTERGHCEVGALDMNEGEPHGFSLAKNFTNFLKCHAR